MYTREFYEAAARRLRPEGIWRSGYRYDVEPRSVATVYAPAHVFPAWRPGGHP